MLGVSSKVKGILISVIVIALIGLVAYGLYAVTSGSAAKTAVKFTTKQGEANDEENNRAIEAVKIETTIKTESDSDFAKRLLKYPSESRGSTEQTESLQSVEPRPSETSSDGLDATEAQQDSEPLQVDGVLQGEDTSILPIEYNGQPVIGSNCVEFDDYNVTYDDQGVIIEMECKK